MVGRGDNQTAMPDTKQACHSIRKDGDMSRPSMSRGKVGHQVGWHGGWGRNCQGGWEMSGTIRRLVEEWEVTQVKRHESGN